MTSSGKMKRRIVLQRATVTQNAFNEDVSTWATLATIWAERRDVSAAESFRAQEVGAQITARFKIRYDGAWSDLNPNDRVSYGGKIYNITAVRESVMNRWLEVDCVARADVEAEQGSA